MDGGEWGLGGVVGRAGGADLKLWNVDSSSLTREGTRVPCIRKEEC